MSDEDIRARYRELFGLTDATSTIQITAPGYRKGIAVGNDFVEHPFQLVRRRDTDHILYSPLTPMTLAAPVEVYLHRDPDSRATSFRFLGCYYDLYEAEYVYHLVIVISSGTLWTSYRLSRGAEAFRQHRVGKLLYAAYA
jgi:hypothetical protein